MKQELVHTAYIDFDIKQCPFCHRMPKVYKIPLWDGSHGYQGEYEYTVKCANEDCKADVEVKCHPNTIYGKTEEECIKEIVDDWNKR